MASPTLWTLAILLVNTAAYVNISPCSPIPGPFQLSRKAVIPPETLLAISNDTRGLFREIQRAPCLHVEYDGLSPDLANRIAIYGTCNFERMFHFSTVYHPVYNCWQSRLATWEGKHCEVDSILGEDISFRHLMRFTTLQKLSNRLTIDFEDLDDGVAGSDQLGSTECSCNVTKDMVNFWHRKCRRQKADKSWSLEPGLVVQWFSIALGMYLLGWAVMCSVVPSIPSVHRIRLERQRKRKIKPFLTEP